MELIVTVDTEADNQWDHGRPVTTENVRYWPTFQTLCERYEIKPTYLITSEIASDKQAIGFLAPLVEANKAEVGAHLHPWTTPPYVNQKGLSFNDAAHAFPSELPESLLEAKLTNLTNQIEKSTGKRPTSFRAGRFGFDKKCAKVLSELGYLVDSSITPLVSWQKTAGYLVDSGGPDFSKMPIKPFKIQLQDQKTLLEIPVTILITGKLLQKYPRWLSVYQWIQGKQNGRYLRLNQIPPQPLWLRPMPDITLRQLSKVWSTAEKLNLPAAIMMFHSSELMPGGSPFWPTKESISQLLSTLEDFFIYIQTRGGKSYSLSSASQTVPTLPGITVLSL